MSAGDLFTRRDFFGVATVAVIGYTLPEGAGAGASASTHGVWELYVGTYTTETASRGIYRISVDRSTGAMGPGVLAAESSNPSYLAMAPDGRSVVAVNELTEYEGVASGAVTLLTRSEPDGALAAVGMRASRGGAPCYVAVDRTGRHALVANYVGGSVAVLPIGTDGTLGEATAVMQHTGSGPHGTRQTGPHAHCIILDAANRFALAADLGIDRIQVYRFDAGGGTLAPADVPAVALPPGAGPRHLAFAPDGRTLYVVNELDSTLVSFVYDSSSGALRMRQRLSTRPRGARGDNLPADLHVHPTGRAVYASNRGDNTIAVFGVDPSAGTLSLMQSVPTEGDWPRNFALDPAGRLLLVANQRSDSIVAFRVQALTGRLTPTGQRLTTPSPVSLVFTHARPARR